MNTMVLSDLKLDHQNQKQVIAQVISSNGKETLKTNDINSIEFY